ncbi:hypothetical protein B0H14DRAFT_1512305 [Mycena olivaceomarginata]|nr:hypothetical protein B0H14DRAFT_1512305 [Mycena olivaceomarginata]
MYPDFWPFNPSLFDNSKDCAWPHVKGSPNTPLVLNFKWQGEKNDAYWLPMIEKDHLAADCRSYRIWLCGRRCTGLLHNHVPCLSSCTMPRK